MDIERALRRLLDKDEIVDLVHRYSFFIDHQQYDEMAALFTDDCVVDYGPGVGPVRNGRADLRAMFAPGGRFMVTSHHNANVLVDFDGDDRAEVRTSLYAWHRFPDGTAPRVWGCYHDTVARTPDGWRIARRQLRVAGNEGMDIEWLPLLDSDEGAS
jgi:ketosteroid isomerase-like protein